jgi:uncharacterized protein YdhG (YjbR/CyaY superfamily)
MDKGPQALTSINEYISAFPPEIRQKLEQLRTTIKTAAPDAAEKISYQMPTFYLDGNLVHFAAYPNHIGFYPAPSGIEAFQDELSRYQTSKGAVRIPLDEPLPLDLISRIVQFRVRENLEKASINRQK